MALDVALTAPELALAAGAHTVKTYLLYAASTAVATARINQAAFSYPLTQLTIDTTSAGWANVAPGMDVLIGTSAGASDVGSYRVWATGNSTTLKLQEVADGDAGTQPIGIRTAAFADNLYVTVPNRFSMYSVLPVITGGVVYEDFSRSPASENTHPAPLVSVKCSTAKTVQYNHIAVPIDDGQTYATVTFLAAATLWPTSSSATFQYTVPGSWTVTAGAANTATFTAQIPSTGQTNYVLKLTVTEDNGQIQTRYIHVWVYDYAANLPILISEYAGDSWDRTGARCQFTLNDTAMAAIPDGAMVCIVQEATFGGGYILSAVTQFVGWLNRADKHTEPGLKSADLEFISPAALLDKRRGTSQLWKAVASPSTWQEVPASICTLSFAQWWLARNRAKGVLELFDFNVYSNAAGGQRLPQIDVTAASLWQQLVSLADGLGKRWIGCDPDGSFQVRQHPSLNDPYPRTGALVVRDTLTASIYHDVDWPREYIPQVGLIEGEAFSWDGAAAQPAPLLALAPGFTPGQSVGDQKLQGQVVDSQATLNALLGHYYAMLNPDYGDITVNIQDNRGALLKPAQGQMVREQIPANYSPDGVAFDRYVIPREVRRTFVKQNDGSIVVDTSIVAEVETAGVAATTKPVPAPNSNLYSDLSFISSLNTPPAISPSGYGQSDSYVPGIVYATLDTITVYRYSIAGAATDIAPGYFSVGQASFITTDPYNFKRFIVTGSASIHATDDYTVALPTWYDTGVSIPSGYAICHPICGSVNRKDWFCWLEKNTGINGFKFAYTADNFATVNRIDLFGIYSIYPYFNEAVCMQVDISNSGSAGYIYLAVPGYNLQVSTDWGLTWADYSPATGATGTHFWAGVVSIPYSLPGGTYNAGHAQPTCLITNNSVLHIAGLRDFTLPITGPYGGPYTLNSWTLDSNEQALIGYTGLLVTHDAWQTSTTRAYPFGGTTIIGVGGWPTNKNFLLVWGDNNLEYSIDNGANWIVISHPGGGNGYGNAVPDLSAYYPSGGVH